MATKPTTTQIQELAERRMHDLGITPPAKDELSFAAKQAVYQEKRKRHLEGAERSLTLDYEVERSREDDAAAREAKQLNDLTEKLRRLYLAQPGATEAGFAAALPRLLKRQREEAVLAGASQFEAHKAKMRASGKYSI